MLAFFLWAVGGAHSISRMDEITLTFMIGRHLEAASFIHIFLSPFICFSPSWWVSLLCQSPGVTCHLGGTEARGGQGNKGGARGSVGAVALHVELSMQLSCSTL